MVYEAPHRFGTANTANHVESGFELPTPDNSDLTTEGRAFGEFAIYRSHSSKSVSFRRSWTHIRNDKTAATAFWFVRRGEIAISLPDGRNIVGPGECALIRSNKPFHLELRPDKSGHVETVHVAAPSHRLYTGLKDDVDAGRPFSAASGDLRLAERTLNLLLEQQEGVDPDNAENLVSTLVTGIGRALSRIAGAPLPRTSIGDRRTAEVMRIIRQKFANPDLTAKMVADACGISPRYLGQILKRQGLTFSQLVLDLRMTAAHEWLRDEQMRHRPISEIAYLAGFSCNAHFSRKFKSRYGCPPRDHRLGMENNP